MELIELLLKNSEVILTVLLLISEALSFIPGIAANSVFGLAVTVIKYLAKGRKSGQGLNAAKKVENANTPDDVRASIDDVP